MAVPDPVSPVGAADGPVRVTSVGTVLPPRRRGWPLPLALTLLVAGLHGLLLAGAWNGGSDAGGLPPAMDLRYSVALRPVDAPPPVVEAAPAAAPAPVAVAAVVARPASAPASAPAPEREGASAPQAASDAAQVAGQAASDIAVAASAIDVPASPAAAAADVAVEAAATHPTLTAAQDAATRAQAAAASAVAAPNRFRAHADAGAVAAAASATLASALPSTGERGPARSATDPLAPAASASAAAPVGLWPPSTRLHFDLEGWYRGEITGSAQVDWQREGSRYQVRMRTAIGPVLSREIVSEGELTAEGLRPRHFSGEQKVMFRSPRRWEIGFAADSVETVDGRRHPAPPGLQDEASQFVQLTWLLRRHPQWLHPGQAIALPLVISRRVEPWVYEVQPPTTLQLPFGPVEAWLLKPRREAGGGDMTAQVWIAPALQHLPVRIRIHQGSESWADLKLSRLPEQALGR